MFSILCVCVCVWLSHVHRLWDPMACSPPSFPVYEIFQARILEWVAFPFSRGSSWPRDQTQVFCIAGGFLTIWATRENPSSHYNLTKLGKTRSHVVLMKMHTTTYNKSLKKIFPWTRSNLRSCLSMFRRYRANKCFWFCFSFPASGRKKSISKKQYVRNYKTTTEPVAVYSKQYFERKQIREKANFHIKYI